MKTSYIPQDYLDQAKVDAKTFYNLVEKHFNIEKLSLSLRYDLYARYFGYKGFSDAHAKSKLFKDKEYLPPCYLEGHLDSTVEFITQNTKIKQDELIKSDDKILLFYSELQREIGMLSKDETINLRIKDFGIQMQDKKIVFHYHHPELNTIIYVKLTIESLAKFYEEIKSKQSYNLKEPKDIDEDLEYLKSDNRYTTSLSLPIFRNPEYNSIRVCGKSVIGCVNNKSDYMFTYSMLNKDNDPYIFVDLFVDELDINKFLIKMEDVLNS